MIDGQVQILDHIYQGVAGHPDDDECTFRADGTDETYCGRTRNQHADRGGYAAVREAEGMLADVRHNALRRRLESTVEGFFDRQLTFPETQEIQRLAAKLAGEKPQHPPLVDQYIDATGGRWVRLKTAAVTLPQPVVLGALPKPHLGPLVGPHPYESRGWRFWICIHCFAPKSLHPRTGYVKARPEGDHTYIDYTAPHWDEGW
jgi:hypothetical protein